MFARLPSGERPMALYGAIVQWLRDYEHEQRRTAIVAAFGLDPETLEGLASDQRSKLERRRTALAARLGLTQQNVRDREDDALDDLTHDWMEHSIETLRAQLEERSPAPSIGLSGLTLDFYRGVDWECFALRRRWTSSSPTAGRGAEASPRS
jgi:hypothetical protein